MNNWYFETEKPKECYYYVVLYANDYRYPVRFETFQQAENFIFRLNLNAYITLI